MNQRNLVLSSLVAMALAVPAVSLAAVSRIDVLTSEQAIELEMGGRACGTPDATVDEVNAVRDQIRAYRKSLGVVGPIEVTIPIAFHVLTNGDEGNVPDSQLEEQVRVMNQRYAGSGYHFRLGSIDRTNRYAWFKMQPLTGTEKQCKMALATDPAHNLNVYTCAPGHSLLGWAYFPFSLPEDHYLHGVVIHYGSLPGGFLTRYNEGLTLVHETGHYLGLLHTFQFGCVDPGDFVDDTPFEASPAFGCPIGRNTCPQPGDDPIHNYMDYTDDACYTEFTPGQLDRTYSIVPIYRPSLFDRTAIAQTVAKPPAGNASLTPGGASVQFRGAFPNPFARETAVHYSLPSRQHVSLSVYNVAGQRVARLVDGDEDAGEHQVSFAPRGLAAGMYFIVLNAGSTRISRGAVLIP